VQVVEYVDLVLAPGPGMNGVKPTMDDPACELDQVPIQQFIVHSTNLQQFLQCLGELSTTRSFTMRRLNVQLLFASS